ncbi:MAG: NFACT RNA binding domain-containing protein [Candidatus Woesearchaeota archaeon]
MAEIELDIKKSVEKNAEVYFEKAKKAKRKIDGAMQAIIRSRKRLEELEKKNLEEIEKEKQKEEKKSVKHKQEWYEKFRWFITSDGFLVIGGRDATSNEIVIKKHTEDNDLIFHTDMSGSPFFVLKTEGKKPSETAMKEVADATCSFSKAFKLGLSSQSVFYVTPDQVSKTPNTGEYLTKGAFVIRGKTNYIDNKINVAIGMTSKGSIMAGPVEAVKKHCKKFVEIVQGDEKIGKIAKQVQYFIGGEIDDLIRAMPTGSCRIKK